MNKKICRKNHEKVYERNITKSASFTYAIMKGSGVTAAVGLRRSLQPFQR